MRGLAARAVRGSCVLAFLSLALALLPPPAISSEKPANKPGEAWPVAVQARYRLHYNSVNVGRLTVSSSTTANTYSVSGSGKVSALFGRLKWWGSSSVSGTIEGGDPAPTAGQKNMIGDGGSEE